MSASRAALDEAEKLLDELCEAQAGLTASLQRGELDGLIAALEEHQRGVARLSSFIGPAGENLGDDPDSEPRVRLRTRARRLRRLNGINEMLSRTRLEAVESGLRALETATPRAPLYGPETAAATGRILQDCY